MGSMLGQVRWLGPSITFWQSGQSFVGVEIVPCESVLNGRYC